LVLVACHPQPESKPDPVAKPKDCELMADHVVGVMKQEKDITEDLEVADKLANLLIRLCTEDKWTVHAQQCFLGVKTTNETHQCAEMLTIPQRDSMVSGIDKAFPKEP
jgi:hypothetical protein